eukprot:Sdes_comp20829_c0_seq1m17420
MVSGPLVLDFLKQKTSPEIYLQNLQKNAHQYSGFNLILSDLSIEPSFFYYSNMENIKISPVENQTVHGLSNKTLNFPWHKVERGKQLFQELISQDITDDQLIQGAFEILSDTTLCDVQHLPNTGIPPELEHHLSSIFIEPINSYGTRTQTVLLLDFDGNLIYKVKDRDSSTGEWTFQTLHIKLNIPL